MDTALLQTLREDGGLLCPPYMERVTLLQQRSWAETPTVTAVPTTVPETLEMMWHLMHCEKGELLAKADTQALDYCLLPSLSIWMLSITRQVI